MKILNLIVILIVISFSNSTEQSIFFVYNAEDDFLSEVRDFFHKKVSPKTYPCQLCKLTYGTFFKKSEWELFLANLNYPYKFIYKNNIKEINYNKNQYPVILFGNKEKNEILISKDELSTCKTIEELIEKMKLQLKEN